MTDATVTTVEEDVRAGLLEGGPVAARHDVALAPFTSWGIGGPAERLVEPESPHALGAAVADARRRGEPVTLLGRGSNVLIDDRGVPGTVICLRNTLTEVRALEGRTGAYRALAGCPMPKLATVAMRDGVTGFEFLIGIPGTIGAGVAINAGVGGRDGTAIDTVLLDALLLDPAEATLARVPAAELRLRYRGSDVPSMGRWVLDATVRGTPGDVAEVRARQREVLTARSAKQPLQRKTSGSVFKQPEGGEPAGWYLDRAGMKGASVGDAVVSDRHANWIENRGGAGSDDVRRLMDRMRDAVEAAFGVTLEREVRFLPIDEGAA